MILYNVTVNVDRSVATEWLQWMKEVHIPEVMATGLFDHYRLMKLHNEVEGEGDTFAIMYYLPSLDHYNTYELNHASALREKHTARYKDKFVAFRSLLEEV